jgi:hypothetical protein
MRFGRRHDVVEDDGAHTVDTVDPGDDAHVADGSVDDDRVATLDDDRAVVAERAETTRTSVEPTVWSPAQIVGLVIGLGYVILGIAALAKTGFDTSHVYRPQEVVWRLNHSPLLGAIEIGFGAILILASVVPGAVRSVMALLGVIALGFGLVVVLDVAPVRMHKWFGVTDRHGWMDIIVGSVLILTAFFMPTVYSPRRRERHVRRVEPVT